MSNRIEDYTDEELVSHYNKMVHMTKCNPKNLKKDVAFYQEMIEEMAKRFFIQVESRKELEPSEQSDRQQPTLILTRKKEGSVMIKGEIPMDAILDFTYAMIKAYSLMAYTAGFSENEICKDLVEMVAQATDEPKLKKG